MKQDTFEKDSGDLPEVACFLHSTKFVVVAVKGRLLVAAALAGTRTAHKRAVDGDNLSIGV